MLPYHRKKGIVTSGSIWIFSLVETFASAINVYTAIVDRGLFMNDVEFGVTLASLPLLLSLLVTCSFADVPCKDAPSKYVSQLKEFPQYPSVREYCSFPSMLTFWWFTPLTMRGYQSALTTSSLYSLRESEMTHIIAPRFIKNWLSQKKKKVVDQEVVKESKPGVMITIMKSFGCYLLCGSFFRLCQDLLQLTNPLLLKWLASVCK